VKRRDLIAHLEAHGCSLVREGAKQSWYKHPATKAFAAIPRHREIVDFMAKKICRELGIPLPGDSKP